jgi:hypothetical protein
MDSFDVPDGLAELAATQHRIAHRQQLIACGVTPDTLVWRVRTGRWQRVLPGIYALFAGRLDVTERFVAAMLHGGPGAQVSGTAALRWHGLRYPPDDGRVLLNVPLTGKRTGSTGFVQIVRTARPDELSLLRSGFEVCSVARAVADMARRTTVGSDVRAVVAEAVQRGRTSVYELFDELDAGPVTGSAVLRRVLAEIGAGVRSRPETELRAILRSSAVLPAILWNPTLRGSSGQRLPTPDGWIDEGAIALEVESREFHLGAEGWEWSMRRDNLYGEYGITVLRFTPRRIREEAAAILRQVEGTYDARSSIRVPVTAQSSAVARPSTPAIRH